MKMMNKFCALMLSVALCAGMAAPAFAYGGEPVEEVEQPVLTSTTDEEDRPFRFHASGTQRTYSTTNIGVMPLTLAPKSDSDFWREFVLTHSKAFGRNA